MEPTESTEATPRARLAVVTIVWNQDTGEISVLQAGDLGDEIVAVLDTVATRARQDLYRQISARAIIVPPAEEFLPR